MLPLQNEHDYISIYDFLKSLGITHPGKIWRKLHQDPMLHLPDHTLKQFTMRDGRKGRLRPAIHIECQQQLLAALQQAGLIPDPQQDLLPLERTILKLLERSFADLNPQYGWRIDHHQFDLYFEVPNLVVQCHRVYQKPSQVGHTKQEFQNLLVQLKVKGVWIDPYADDFEPGDWVYLVRQQLKDHPAS